MDRNKKRQSLSLLDVTSSVFSVLFIFLAIFHFRNIKLFQFKLGMSHFFSPTLVGIMGVLIPLLNLMVGLFLIFHKGQTTYIFAILMISGYLLYNSILYAITGSDCGCASIFFDINLKNQIVIFASILFALIVILIFLKKM